MGKSQEGKGIMIKSNTQGKGLYIMNLQELSDIGHT